MKRIYNILLNILLNIYIVTLFDELNLINIPKNKFRRFLFLKARSKFLESKGSFIGAGAKFEREPNFPHGILGIFISNNAKIGKNVTIFQQVTIGSNNLEGTKRRGSPIIGDNVYIGAGAKIIGRVQIGNGCRIGANAVVIEDIPENSTVVMEKSKIITKNTEMNNFFKKI